MPGDRVITISPEATVLINVLIGEWNASKVRVGNEIDLNLSSKKGVVETALCLFAAQLAVDLIHQQGHTALAEALMLDSTRHTYNRLGLGKLLIEVESVMQQRAEQRAEQSAPKEPVVSST